MAYLVTDNNTNLAKIDVTLSADTAPGSFLAVGEVVGVVEVGGSAGETVALTLNGTWEADTADTFAVGDKAYLKPDGTITKNADDGAGTSYTFTGTCFDAGTGYVVILLGR